MTEVASARATTRRWPRRLAFIGGSLLLLLVITWFVVTSTGFLKGVILPRVSKAMNAEITVGDASLSPFSQIVLKDLKVKTTGSEPLVSAQEMRARYSLWSILGGNIKVDEVTLVSPTVNLVMDATGNSNLDPITTSSPKDTAKPPTAASKAPQIDIRKVAIENGTVRVIQEKAGGGRCVTGLSNVNFALTDLKNGQSGKLSLSADVTIDQTRPAPGTNGTAQGHLEGNFNLSLANDLNLAALQGTTRISVAKATGALAELAGVAANLDTDITPTELKKVALRFQKDGTDLSELRVHGPFELAKSEGRLQIELRPVDKRLLNLASAKSGLDFRDTTVSSTNEVTLAQGGKQIAVKGQIEVARFSVAQSGKLSPAIDLRAAYDTAANLNEESALLRVLTLNGTQAGRPLLLSALSSPMKVAWGNNANAVGDATFSLLLTNLNLQDWRAFAPDLAAEGNASGTLKIASQQAGKQIGFDLAAQVIGLSAKTSSNEIRQSDVTLRSVGSATEFKRYQIDSAEIRLSRQGQSALALTSSGRCDTEKKDADLQLTLDSSLPRLLDIAPQPGMSLTSGNAQLRARISQKGGEQVLAGQANLKALSGSLAGKKFADLAAGADFDLSILEPKRIDFRRCALTLSPTRLAPTNAVALQGRIDLSHTNAIEGALKLAADALDLTAYYDMFAGQPKPAGAETSTKPSPGGSPPSAQTEPEAIQLGVKLLTFDANIGRCFLREIAMTNVLASVRIEGNHVVVKPLQLTLNGAPVSGDIDLDLGVAGYRYAVNLNGDRIPVEPLANSFSPDYRGRAKGDLQALIAIKGAGVTGPNLRKNLDGQFSLNFTNANIQIVGARLKTFLMPIAAAVRAPDLLETPLNWVGAGLQAGGGTINVSQLALVSQAFTAKTGGKIPIADSLMNSPLQKWPMDFSLLRSLAERIKMVPKDTPTNAVYARLPEFIRVAGTLDAPKADIDLRALAGSALEMLGERIPGVDKKTGELLQGVGSLLSGKKSSATNLPSAGTNQPATNTPVKPSLLDLLPKQKK